MGSENLKKAVKRVCWLAGIDLTRNMAYDRQTANLMKRILNTHSNCIDIGSHDGDILAKMIRLAPKGVHFAFEPIPEYYQYLKRHFGSFATIFPYALSDKEDITSFQYVKNAPAYSGLKKRQYNKDKPDIEELTVETRRLDRIIPHHIHIDFIKIDVEGAEYQVMKGAIDLLSRCRPFIVFEFGLGASDYYGAHPGALFTLLESAGLNINTLPNFLKQTKPLCVSDFEDLYYQNREYYFIAFP